MPEAPADDLLRNLRADGVVRHADARLTPLTGGVSSDIYLVHDGPDRFVVKRALARLKVLQEWLADTGRNRNERDYLRYVAAILPDAVPAIRPTPPDRDYFAMEYLGEGFANWKQQMLAGTADPATAAAAGRVLGTIHLHSAADRASADRFAALPHFEQLRISPYLLATAERHPDLRVIIHAEADRLRACRLALAHGDYSPKNILVGRGGRIVVLDCEVAWHGDPAFDVAFLLNHLHLKALARPTADRRWERMIASAWGAYRDAAGGGLADRVEPAAARLLPMLLLARVDGKSPVEYLNPAGQGIVRAFARRAIAAGLYPTVATMSAAWLEFIAKEAP